MSDWLKRDPENRYLIGPDDCHYFNEHQAAHYGLLHLCGCGSPEDAYNFCRGALACFDRRGYPDNTPTKDWVNAETSLAQLIVRQPNITAHVFAHLFTHLDLLEHGSSVSGSWLTKDGERIIDMEEITNELDQEY